MYKNHQIKFIPTAIILILSIFISQAHSKDKTESPQPENAEMDQIKDEIIQLKEVSISYKKSQDESSWLFLVPWLTGGSGLIALASILLSQFQRKELLLAFKQSRLKIDKMQKQINNFELKIERQNILNLNRQIPSSSLSSNQQYNDPPYSDTPIAKFIEMKPHEVTQPEIITSNPVTKASLIEAINNFDRQQLRNASTAELNVTSESENALATGRAITTKLEEVPGGGSYLLVPLQGEHWLFPTERTLKGFGRQSTKILFQHEQKAIGHPQLVEPALLAKEGTLWTIKAVGRINTP